MNRWCSVVVLGVSLGILQGCAQLLGVGIGAAGKNVDPKPPKEQTAASCQVWECWDGYACGPCQEAAPADKASKSSK